MEVAGLVLGTLGIAGIFKSCVENFDIFVRAKDFSEEFDLLCTQVREFGYIRRTLSHRPSSYLCNKHVCSSGESRLD